MNGLSTMRRSRSARFSGLAATAAASSLALALMSPGLTLATDLHQSPPISWDDASFQGSADECDGTNLTGGQVLWHFVQTQVPDGVDSGNLTAEFDTAGVIGPQASDKKTGSTLHWTIITGEDTLLSASSDVDSDGLLNLSHICSNTASGGTEGSTATPTPAGGTEGSTATPTPAGGVEGSTATPTPAGGVEGSTGKPKATVPPTSTLDEAPASSSSSLPIVLIGLSGLMTGLFMLRPSVLKIRNR